MDFSYSAEKSIFSIWTLSIVTIWGFLENFDQVPHAPGFYVAVLWFAMLGVGGVVTRFRA